jgi:hypothetical protein
MTVRSSEARRLKRETRGALLDLDSRGRLSICGPWLLAPPECLAI